MSNLAQVSDYLKSDDIYNKKKYDTQRPIDLNFERYAQISGVKGKQFNKDVYSAMLKFRDLERFLNVFPKIQRSMSKTNVKSIKRYVLSGIEGENPQDYMRFFNSITVTSRGTIMYDDDKRTILIDTNNPLSINDGQHRTEGIKEAIEELKIKRKKSVDFHDISILEKQIEVLEEMTIPLVIFNGLDEKQESQLFFDLNNLARRPSKSANIRLSQTDLFAVMAKEIAEENKYLTHYGVETDKQSIFKNNPNTFLLTTVYNSIKELLYGNLTLDKNFLKEKNFDRVKKELSSTFDKILQALPSDIDVKGKYLIEKSYTLLGISKFIALAKDTKLFADDSSMYDFLNSIDFTYKNMDWMEYGGVKGLGKNDNISFTASSSGQRAVFNYLIDKTEEFNKKKEKSYIVNK